MAEIQKTVVPVLPLRDVVVYPHMVIPLFVGRDKSVVALDQAMGANKQILLIAQTSPERTTRATTTCTASARSPASCSC